MSSTIDKSAIVVFSDPKNGGDEALGRLFNALGAAYDYKQAGAEVQIIFQGAGTRWPAELQQENHPAHTLYNEVADAVQGISCGCADVFGAEPSGLDLITNNPLPGTPGISSFVALRNEGFEVLTF